MKFSKEKTDEIKSQVRLQLAINPRASCRDIGGVLGHNHKFINLLKNEIHKELAENISQQSLQQEVGKFELAVEETGKILWEIMNNPKSENGEKINAVKCLISNYSFLLEKKTASGLLAKDKPPISGQNTMGTEEIRLKIRRLLEITGELNRTEEEITQNVNAEGDGVEIRNTS